MKDLLAPQNFRSKKILAAAKDCPCCMMCNRPNNGTVVMAHYQGYRQHAFGKGVAEKPTDAAVAALCSDCHDEVDGRLTSTCANEVERSESFLAAIVKTFDWLLKEGVIG